MYKKNMKIFGFVWIYSVVVTTAGHVTRQPIGALEDGSVKRRLKLSERDVTERWKHASVNIETSRFMQGGMFYVPWKPYAFRATMYKKNNLHIYREQSHNDCTAYLLTDRKCSATSAAAILSLLIIARLHKSTFSHS